jgi:hypothetical protein
MMMITYERLGEANRNVLRHQQWDDERQSKEAEEEVRIKEQTGSGRREAGLEWSGEVEVVGAICVCTL